MGYPPLRPAPYLSYRHARAESQFERGRLPPSWRLENIASAEVVEVDFVEGKPGLTIRMSFAPTLPSWSALTLAQYLPAPPQAVVALAGQVALRAFAGVEAAMFALREWRGGGEMVREVVWQLHLAGEPQVFAMALEVGGEGRLVQPVLLVRRTSHAAAHLTIALWGMAFGSIQDHPRWLCS